MTALTVALTEAYPAQRDTVLDALRASALDATVQAEDGTAVPVTELSFEASGPALAGLSGTPGATPDRSESVREFLLRAPHAFEPDQGSYVQPRPCACGKWPGAAIHHGAALLDTYGYLSGVAAALNEAAGAGMDVPEVAGARADVGELAPGQPAATGAGEEDAPPLPEAKEKLPPGTIGFAVATRRTLGGGGWFATADFTADREVAEHIRKVTGGTLVRIVVDE